MFQRSKHAAGNGVTFNPAVANCFDNRFVDSGDNEGTAPAQSETDIWGISAEATYRLSDALTVKSITAWRDLESDFSRDGDHSPHRIVQFDDDLEQDQFTQELQLLGSVDKLTCCTAAFCTILNYGLGTAEDYVVDLVEQGVDVVDSPRLGAILHYALEVNRDPAGVEDHEVDALREHGLSDKGIVQLTHVVSDFASYNRLNLALQTDYDYRDIWRGLALNRD